MKRRGFHLVVAILAACLLAAPAFAQGGGASTTGSINGKVADSSGGVLPGVTVSATSASLMGVQTSVTDDCTPIIDELVALTVTPGSTPPLLSVTLPLIDPVVLAPPPCANAGDAIRHTASAATTS